MQTNYAAFARWFRSAKKAGFPSVELERAATRLRNDLWAMTHNPGRDTAVFRRGLEQSLAEFEKASAQ